MNPIQNLNDTDLVAGAAETTGPPVCPRRDEAESRNHPHPFQEYFVLICLSGAAGLLAGALLSSIRSIRQNQIYPLPPTAKREGEISQRGRKKLS